MTDFTVGSYLVSRLEEVGVRHVFGHGRMTGTLAHDLWVDAILEQHRDMGMTQAVKGAYSTGRGI